VGGLLKDLNLKNIKPQIISQVIVSLRSGDIRSQNILLVDGNVSSDQKENLKLFK